MGGDSSRSGTNTSLPAAERCHPTNKENLEVAFAFTKQDNIAESFDFSGGHPPFFKSIAEILSEKSGLCL
jgi:hypothetical protein